MLGMTDVRLCYLLLLFACCHAGDHDDQGGGFGDGGDIPGTDNNNDPGGGAPRPTVIFDIDGTLTFNELPLPFVRKGSREATQLYLDLGYEIILLSARPCLTQWQADIVLWLYKFPTDEFLKIVCSPNVIWDPDMRGWFKLRVMKELRDEWNLVYTHAYGDQPSDFGVYHALGIPQSNVFAFRRLFEPDCSPGLYADCMEDYVTHNILYIARQPFVPRPDPAGRSGAIRLIMDNNNHTRR
ncbi:expressed unknown protein [Seminavis robusta]|uniref:LNS2/PITP domain-containing protein n=1 Tax=Seminavis robusta TaxID=568900 RepID=A0A9N8DQU5_9STRA|nr:expressed unknown protein [Seminavis robusta]|eukprot:Sro221_g090910.1 n/a (240) ;mRNA; f:18114-18833